MGKVQLLVTTMHEKDFSKVKSMNVHSDVLFANQSDCYEYQSEEFNGFSAQMITTATRGLSRNRNLAITCSSPESEILVFSDDDLIFIDGYEQLIENEFKKNPHIEAIKFSMISLDNKRILTLNKITRLTKANVKNVTSMGVCAMAIKRSVLLEKNLKFNENFGSGTENYCGEDTIFFQDIIKKGVKLYFSPIDIAYIDQSETTWFEGYNERYFEVGGKVISTVYPKLARLLVIRSAYKFSKRESCSMKFWDILKCYYKGIKGDK